jgi:hypothetical protein
MDEAGAKIGFLCLFSLHTPLGWKDSKRELNKQTSRADPNGRTTTLPLTDRGLSTPNTEETLELPR